MWHGEVARVKGSIGGVESIVWSFCGSENMRNLGYEPNSSFVRNRRTQIGKYGSHHHRPNTNLTGRGMPSLDRVLAGNTIAAMQIFATQRWKQVMDGED